MVNQQATRTWGRCVRRLLSFQCNCAASIITAAERWSAVDVERWRVCYAIDTGMPSIPFVLFIVRPGSDNIAPQDSHCCVGNFTAGNSLNNAIEFSSHAIEMFDPFPYRIVNWLSAGADVSARSGGEQSTRSSRRILEVGCAGSFRWRAARSSLDNRTGVIHPAITIACKVFPISRLGRFSRAWPLQALSRKLQKHLACRSPLCRRRSHVLRGGSARRFYTEPRVEFLSRQQVGL